MTVTEKNKALVRRYFDEIEAGNLDVIDELSADELTAKYDVARSDIERLGRDGLTDVIDEILTAFPDTSIVSQSLYAEGNTVISIQTWRGTHLGEYRGVPPSGNEITYKLWGRFVIEDGEIVRSAVQGSDFDLFAQLGLELSIEGYQTLIETAPNPIVIADADTGRVLETNTATESLVERPRSEIIGTHQMELHPSDQRYDSLYAESVAQARDSPVSVATFEDGSDIELVRADGSRLPVEVSAQVVTLAERPTLVSIYRDVSQQRRREQRTQVLNRLLRHNLRNEVSVITGLAGVLGESLDGENEEKARQIQHTARELAGLGEKARLAAQLAAVDNTQATQVSARGLVDEVVAEVGLSDIQTDFSDPVTVLTDRGAVKIALREALENAVEHTTSDPRIEAHSENGDHVEIAVTDSGPGIPSAELAALREGEETPLTHGSGIGLWLIYWATDAVRGDVDFERTGSGTRVVLSIPSLDAAS
ncbi:ester cyclase [Halovenus salina]|uniref:histidine kinase n=1 Tax=Halovenus salina TaxID=1510225 RepID=A0ABD5W2B3_9EURY|nr:ester cyclase [Halovenus salina]